MGRDYSMPMPLQPFDNYLIEVDRDLEEVSISAWDEEAPQDSFHGRWSLEELEDLLSELTDGLRRR